MNKELKLTVTTFISVNHYMNYRVIKQKGKGGKSFMSVMPYKPKETLDFEKSFKKYVKEEIKKQNWSQPEKGKFIYVDSVIFFDRTDRDSNNYWKSILDICTECGVWIDDNIVLESSRRIYYDNKNPRIELTITEAPFIGIFDNIEELEQFESKCKNCKRYNRNCSLLKKAKESRIQEEIELIDGKWTCNKFNSK